MATRHEGPQQLPVSFAADDEWLQADGRGGFASGTVGMVPTRRYHALLLTSTTPPTGRMVLVNGIKAWVEQGVGDTPISTLRYASGETVPDLSQSLVRFLPEPWPSWVFRLTDGAELTQEILVDPIGGDTVLRWRCTSPDAILHVRPLLSVRDYHALHHENPAFDARASVAAGNVSWRPYNGPPAVGCLTNGSYRHDVAWFRGVLYTVEQERGLDFAEDLASPGIFSWCLAGGEAVMLLRAGDGLAVRAAEAATRIFMAETARRSITLDRLDRAAEAYLVDRSPGCTLVAGYPWFTDWGRDTFIALRGLLLGTSRVAQAEAVLLTWSDLVSEGMLPNRFGDDDAPEYNTADASLWYVIAVHDLLAQPGLGAQTRARLQAAVEAILEGHVRGTRFEIGVDQDGLLRAGVPGRQLTWMDAKVGDWVVTPRIGKPVEIQALWYNALRIASAWNPRWSGLAVRAKDSFLQRFPDTATGGLFDVVDADHIPGAVDRSVRPNQIFTVGGLPFALMEGEAGRPVLDCVEGKLLTPLGLRSLSPDDPHYVPHYAGSPLQRDGAYHQGTVWPWLIGPFTQAWLRVNGDTEATRALARERFVAPLMAHLDTAGLGHVSEVADGDAPHTPGGCPFQAWSVGELIRARAMTAALAG
jgi:predicted glycogen debranching enzyme